MKYLNLVLAAIWFTAAGFLYFYDIDGARQRPIPIPYYVLALILGIFNVVRWWTIQLAQHGRTREDPIQVRRPRLRRESDDLAEPDPNFTFQEPPQARNGPPSP